jgi:SpoVK/Ycf46/Vps4 family AAA+-type ATPase
MSEPQILDLGAPPQTCSERLSREIAIACGRLAALIEPLPAAQQELASGVAFLHALYETVSEGRPPKGWNPDPSVRRPQGTVDPIDRLIDGLGCSALDAQILIVAGMAEEHEGLGSVMSGIHVRNEPRATVGLAAQLLCETTADRLEVRRALEVGPLVRHGVVRLTGEGPLFVQTLECPTNLWSALHGINVWPPTLTPEVDQPVSKGYGEWLGATAARRATRAIAENRTCCILVSADQLQIAVERAVALCHAAGVPWARFSLEAPLADEIQKRLNVFALAHGVVPVVGIELGDGPAHRAATQLVPFHSPVIIAIRTGSLRIETDAPVLQVFADALSPAARVATWRAVLPELATSAVSLAASYTLEPSIAASVARDARCIASVERRSISRDDVVESVRGRANSSVSAGVRLIHPTATWDFLVLQRNQKALLHQAVDRLRHQARVLNDWGFLAGRTGARGVRMLFSGPPGTGKTLAAEVLASALGVDLLTVDLSRVVSKWIGETEKHLAEVFDAAERAQVVLLFDEADALFGQRTEVSDAHDRYANLETAYLLTRLERFEGIAVLSTNLRRNIDPAFTRRLEFVVEFEEPTQEYREALWNCHLPSKAPLSSDIDLRELAAEYAVVGAMIRNAAVAAAFIAAGEDSRTITRDHLIRAVRYEYEKAGRAFPDARIRKSDW